MHFYKVIQYYRKAACLSATDFPCTADHTAANYFTAGIGENVGMIREKVCSYLGFLGVTIDAKANEAMGEEVVISGADSKVKVAVIPTNEELAICRDTVALVK